MREYALLNCRHKGIINKKFSFFVVDTQSNPILGYQASVEMGFVKVASPISSLSTKKSVQKIPIPKEFDDVFAGIGKLPGKVEIHVKKNAIPFITPVWRIPFAVHERVKSELERLEKLDIIERVVAPTEWVNSIVAVEKSDGSLRLCLDPRELNKSIERTMEETFGNLKGVGVIVDDILVSGKDEEHDENLRKVLEKAT